MRCTGLLRARELEPTMASDHGERVVQLSKPSVAIEERLERHLPWRTPVGRLSIEAGGDGRVRSGGK